VSSGLVINALVTDYWSVNDYITLSTSQKAVMPCGWGVKAGVVCLWVAGKTV